MHEEFDCHKDYVNQLFHPETVCYVNENFGETLIYKKTRNRQIFLTVPQNIQFLSRHVPAFWGNNNEGNSEQIIKLSTNVDSRITFLDKTKYLHDDTKNKITRLMAFRILRDVAKDINNSVLCSIMADQVADCSNMDQFVRRVDTGF